MIRNLKILMLAAMVLAAFGAISASGASASQFHCNTPTPNCKITIKPDGTTKTAHHVFIVRKGAASGSVTCNTLEGTATEAKTSEKVTLINLAYAGCTLAGSAATIDTAGCDYLFNANEGKVEVVCSGANKIKITAGACTVEFGSQALKGITYTNINAETEITVSTLVNNVKGVAGAGCAGLTGFTGEFSEGEYTTGNTIVKGYEDVVATGLEGKQVNVWWT